MSTDDLTSERVEQAARERLEQRLVTVRRLTETQQQRRASERALTEATQVDQAAYTAALEDGWSDAELRDLGFESPSPRGIAPRARRRSKPRSAVAPAPSASDPAQAHEG